MQRAGVGLVLVLICAGWAAFALRQPQAALEPVTPAPAPAFPALDATYEVLDRAVSPSGTQEAFAAFRRGQSAGVFVRDRGEREPRALWVPPQPNGQLRERTSWPVSLAWAPDGEHIAFLVLTHKGDLKQVRRAEVALWSVPLGGATPQEFQDDLGACYCLQFTPCAGVGPQTRPPSRSLCPTAPRARNLRCRQLHDRHTSMRGFLVPIQRAASSASSPVRAHAKGVDRTERRVTR
jgi:hypothetical protein